MVDLNNVKIAFFDLEDQNIYGFIDQCKNFSIDLCLVSLNQSSFNISDALACVQKTYGVSLELCSSASSELTFTVMETMSKLRNYNCNEVLLVSTNTEAVSLAEQKGFLTLKDLAKDFTITEKNRVKIGYTDSTTNLEIPSMFYDEADGAWYSVTGIGCEAFYDCANLKSVTIPDIVTYIGTAAFQDCISLESIIIPDSVYAIDNYAFDGCTALKSINIPNAVTAIKKGTFRDCQNLTSIEIPDSVTVIESQAFDGCQNLISIIIPDSIVSVKDSAFSCCWSLESVVIGSSVTEIGSCAFSHCPMLTSVVIPNSVVSIGDCAFWMCKNLTSVVIPDSVISIGTSAFSGCTNLKSVLVPDSVTSIGTGAFRNVPQIIYSGSVSGSPWGADSIVRSFSLAF